MQFTMPLEPFSELLASPSPTPGGGSAAAAAGVLGASLIEMVAAITGDKPSPRRGEILTISEKVFYTRREFLTLIDEDTAAYRGIMDARLLPRKTEAEQAAYASALQAALKTAILMPYRTLKAALDCLRLAKDLSADYYRPTASDLGLGAQALKTAAYGAELTMIINLRSVTDPGFGKQYRYESQTMLEEALGLADDIYRDVREYLLELS